MLGCVVLMQNFSDIPQSCNSSSSSIFFIFITVFYVKDQCVYLGFLIRSLVIGRNLC